MVLLRLSASFFVRLERLSLHRVWPMLQLCLHVCWRCVVVKLLLATENKPRARLLFLGDSSFARFLGRIWLVAKPPWRCFHPSVWWDWSKSSPLLMLAAVNLFAACEIYTIRFRRSLIYVSLPYRRNYVVDSTEGISRNQPQKASK